MKDYNDGIRVSDESIQFSSVEFDRDKIDKVLSLLEGSRVEDFGDDMSAFSDFDSRGVTNRTCLVCASELETPPFELCVTKSGEDDVKLYMHEKCVESVREWLEDI